MKVQETTTRTFTFSGSKSMLGGDGIENIISNYVGSSPTFPSTNSYVSSPSALPSPSSHSASPSSGLPYSRPVYNLDAPLPVVGSMSNSMPKMLEYKPSQAQAGGQYSAFNYNPTNYFLNPTPQEAFAPENFLHFYRPDTQFIDGAEKVQDFVKEAFRKTTGKELPEHINITVCDEKKFKMLHKANGGTWNPGIQGFSVHLNNQVVVKQNKLDVVMLVIGHELGHVLSPCLGNAHDEEAKAFAFELAWMKTIKQHNVADLADNININFQPASNGLHDVAFGFVKKMVDAGKRAMDVFNGLVSGQVGMEFSLR